MRKFPTDFGLTGNSLSFILHWDSTQDFFWKGNASYLFMNTSWDKSKWIWDTLWNTTGCDMFLTVGIASSSWLHMVLSFSQWTCINACLPSHCDKCWIIEDDHSCGPQAVPDFMGLISLRSCACSRKTSVWFFLKTKYSESALFYILRYTFVSCSTSQFVFSTLNCIQMC